MPPAASRGAQEGEVESVAESLARIEARILSLHTELTSQDHRREPVGNSSIGEALAKVLERLEAVDPDGVMRTQATSVDWASLIDKSLARCLVEHGKTPYNEGVAPLLRQATRELAATEDEFSEASRLLKARNEQLHKAFRVTNKLAPWTPPKAERQALTDAHKARREEILARFRKVLAALDS